MKSIRKREGGGEKLEGIFVVEIKTEINGSGKGGLERGSSFKTTLSPEREGDPHAVSLAHQPASELRLQVTALPGLLGQERCFQSSGCPALHLRQKACTGRGCGMASGTGTGAGARPFSLLLVIRTLAHASSEDVQPSL